MQPKTFLILFSCHYLIYLVQLIFFSAVLLRLPLSCSPCIYSLQLFHCPSIYCNQYFYIYVIILQYFSCFSSVLSPSSTWFSFLPIFCPVHLICMTSVHLIFQLRSYPHLVLPLSALSIPQFILPSFIYTFSPSINLAIRLFPY